MQRLRIGRPGRVSSIHTERLTEFEAIAKKRFALPDTIEHLAEIRSGLTHLKKLTESEKAATREELISRISVARDDLEEEHQDLGIAKVDRRVHIGLFAGVGLLAAAIFNVYTFLVPNEFLRTISSLSNNAEKNAHVIAAVVVGLAMLVPGYLLWYKNNFDRLKNGIMETFDEIEKQLKKQG